MINKRVKFLIIVVITFLIFGNKGYSQDPHFSQFYANPLYLNPAMAGSAICPRLIMNYRNQWPSISGTYVTYNASYDQDVEAISGAIGLLFNQDKAGEGALTTTTISGIYTYNLKVSRGFSIKTGFQGTYFFKKIDWDKLYFGDQIDPKHGFIYDTNEPTPEALKVSNSDFSAGIVGYGENFFVGFAAHHLTQPNEGFISPSELPMKYTGHAGFTISLTKRGTSRRVDDPTLSPNILYMMQRDFNQINYGMYFNKYPLVGGLWFRQNFPGKARDVFIASDALIALIGVQTGVLKFGYSYDITVSKLKNTSGGSHEFSCAIQFPCRPPKKKIRIINCPSF